MASGGDELLAKQSFRQRSLVWHLTPKRVTGFRAKISFPKDWKNRLPVERLLRPAPTLLSVGSRGEALSYAAYTSVMRQLRY